MTARMVAAGGVELWTESVGDPADPALPLIAGDTLPAVSWPDPLVERLVAGGHHVLRYDHRDTGRSTWREFAVAPYTFDDLAADAVAVLDGWEVGTAHVVGFGMGGGVAQLLALDHPTRLRSLVLSNCFALGVDFFGNWERALSGEPAPDGLPTPERWFVELALGPPGPALSRAVAGDFYDEAEVAAAERIAVAHAGRVDDRPVHPHAEVRAGIGGRGPELGGIAAPTLVIQGLRDPINPPPHGRHLAGLIPGARLVEIAGMGHSLSAAVHGQVASAVLSHVSWRETRR